MKTKLSVLSASVILMLGCQSITPNLNDDVINDTSSAKVPAKTSKQPRTIEDIEQDVAEVNDVWQRIRDGMQLKIAEKELVDKYRQWYIDNPRHLEIVTQRSEPFLYLIENRKSLNLFA